MEIKIGAALKTRKGLIRDWWRSKSILFFWEEIDGIDQKVEVEDCDKCYGNGNIITPNTEHLPDIEWEWEGCPKCDGSLLQIKRIAI